MLAWDDLASFLAIARHGTLSGAARALGVRQTTMGRRLAALEARAGARLLQKTPRGYVTTPAGEAILGNVERIESEALAIERRITGQDVRLEGVVRLTTVEALAVRHVVPALAELARRHPGIVVELVTDDRNLSLTMREADIALRAAARASRTSPRAASRPPDSCCARRAVPGGTGPAGFRQWRSGPRPGDDGCRPDGHAGNALPGGNPAGGPPGPAHQQPRRAGRRGGPRHRLPAGIRRGRSRRGRARPTQPAAGAELWLVVHNDIRHTPRIRAVTDLLAEALRRMVRFFLSEEKEAKRLLSVVLGVARPGPHIKRTKVFWFFFSKKNPFLPSRESRAPHPITMAAARGCG